MSKTTKKKLYTTSDLNDSTLIKISGTKIKAILEKYPEFPWQKIKEIWKKHKENVEFKCPITAPFLLI